MIDSRQVMIVLQNALGHAMELLKHNKMNGDKKQIEVLKLLEKPLELLGLEIMVVNWRKFYLGLTVKF